MEKILRRPLIHIGTPKTATKTLQWRIFAQHPEVHYLGRFDGGDYRHYRRYGCCRNRTVQALMRKIVYGDVRKPDFDRAKALYATAVNPANSSNLVPVWSWESHSTDSLEMQAIRARNLKHVFQDASVLMTIRHPVDLVESSYLQQIRDHNVGSRKYVLSPAFIPSMDEWVKWAWDTDVLQLSSYAETVKIFMAEFGRERMHVKLFEQAERNSSAFFADICDIAGIDPVIGVALAAGHRDNSAWTQRQLRLLKHIAGSRWRHALYRATPIRLRQVILDLDPARLPRHPEPKPRLHMDRALAEALLQRTRPGSAWIMREFGLPLDAHHYFDVPERNRGGS
jgi:hypothetical protein